jgi:TM2 domain-containing membrane protein YozV
MFMPRQNLLKPQTSSVFRNKVTLGLLAALLGGVGAHWWYLKRPYAWLVSASSVVLIGLARQANVWWENPAFFLLFIPILDGFIEAVVWCLMSDERFDTLLNPGLQRLKPSGWGPVLVAAFTLLIGTVLLMLGIAVIVLYVWTMLGWLDGFDLNAD